MAFFAAWAVGEGIVIWRSWRTQGGPPWPGQMMVSSAVFVILAIVAEAGDNAKKAALMTAWGLNVSAFLNLPWTQQGTLPAPATTGWWPNAQSKKIGGDTVILFGAGAGAGCAAGSAPQPNPPKAGTSTGSEPAGAGSKLSIPTNPVIRQGTPGRPGLGVIVPVAQNPRDPLNPSVGPGRPGQTGAGTGFT